ncbi:MAG TPA: flagellar basal body protein [Alphaproteobacteria bacterium]
MNWLDQNQRVIAQNVANADTPGYQSMALEKVDFASLMNTGPSRGAKLQMASTDSGHSIGGASDGMGRLGSDAQKVKYEASPDDNAIVIEEQLFKANQNASDYQLATNLYRRNAGMLRMVLQGSR